MDGKKPLEEMPAWLLSHAHDEPLYAVMVDSDQRYAMVSASQWRELPQGGGSGSSGGGGGGPTWTTIATNFSKSEASAYVELCWTDMLPKSHRDALRRDRCCGYDKLSDEECAPCTVCGEAEWVEGNEILLCDGNGCASTYHLFCLDRPLRCVPEGDWFCPECARPTA